MVQTVSSGEIEKFLKLGIVWVLRALQKIAMRDFEYELYYNNYMYYEVWLQIKIKTTLLL